MSLLARIISIPVAAVAAYGSGSIIASCWAYSRYGVWINPFNFNDRYLRDQLMKSPLIKFDDEDAEYYAREFHKQNKAWEAARKKIEAEELLASTA